MRDICENETRVAVAPREEFREHLKIHAMMCFLRPARLTTHNSFLKNTNCLHIVQLFWTGGSKTFPSTYKYHKHQLKSLAVVTIALPTSTAGLLCILLISLQVAPASAFLPVLGTAIKPAANKAPTSHHYPHRAIQRSTTMQSQAPKPTPSQVVEFLHVCGKLKVRVCVPAYMHTYRHTHIRTHACRGWKYL